MVSKQQRLYSLIIAAISVTLGLTMTGFTKKRAEEAPAATGDSAPSTPSAQGDAVWVGKSDGALGCKPDSGQGLETGEAELKKAGIQVLASKKGSDGKMHMQVCGAPTGSMNLYQVSSSDLAKAQGMGFVQTKN